MHLVVSALAACCAAITLLAGAVPAGAAQPQRPQGKTVEVAFKIGPVPALGATQHAAASADCAPSFGTLDRHDSCWGVALTFIFFINGRPVGTTVAALEQSIHLNPGAKRPPVTWIEDDTVLGTASRGRTAPIAVTLEASCDKPCHAVAHFRGVLRRGLHGTVDYTDHLAVDEVNKTPTHYKLLWVAPPFAPLNVPHWNSPWAYRCDRALPGIAGPGCVFPEFTPTFTVSRAEFGAAAAMIQWAQVNMSAHWGWQGHGKPLRRLAGPKIDANRRVICETDFHRFAPWEADHGKVKVKDSCDEFPFAATYESGAMGPFGVKTGAACQQVKAVKTSDTGSEAKIWNAVTPYSKFIRHAAKCVRGHIPLTLNVSLGGNTGYRGFIKAVRLLDNDPFWLEVTA
jgi:hypothetical protein